MFLQDKEILVIAISGVMLVFFLASVFVFSIVRYRLRVSKEFRDKAFMRKQFETELMQAKLETQEQSFHHIGRELHDNIGQLLSTTKMLISVAEITLSPVPDFVIAANQTLGRAIQELRYLSRSLDTDWIEQFSLQDNITIELARINSSGFVQAECKMSGQIVISAESQIILFRIVQEAIQNAIKHAQPSRLLISLISNESVINIKIANNGNPLPPEFHGMGTNNMKNRALLLGGVIFWKSNDGQTIVEIIIPFSSTVNG